MPKRTGELTELERNFVKEAAKGRSFTSAARAAGYSDPSGEVDRLMNRPLVRDRLFMELQKTAISWMHLVEKAKRVLYANLNVGQGTDSRLKPSDRNMAARIVLETVRRSGASPIVERAEFEDKAASKKELVRTILREHKEENLN